MKITVIGTGYVGLVTGACLSDVGIEVTCVDIDQKKIDGLKNGILPIYEPGLKEIVERNYAKGRLNFSTDLSEAIKVQQLPSLLWARLQERTVLQILKYVLAVADQIGKTMTDYLVVITKSTVPVGTAEKVRGAVANALDLRDVDFGFDVASNPEFLKEGAAIDDFMKPDRIVVGVDSDEAQENHGQALPSVHLERPPGDLYGHPFCGDDQICSKRHVGDEDFLHERHCQPV